MCQLLAYDWCTDNSTTDIGAVINRFLNSANPIWAWTYSLILYSIHAKKWHTKNYCSHLNNYWWHTKNYGVLQYILRCAPIQFTVWHSKNYIYVIITGMNRKNYDVLQYILRCDTVIFIFLRKSTVFDFWPYTPTCRSCENYGVIPVKITVSLQKKSRCRRTIPAKVQMSFQQSFVGTFFAYMAMRNPVLDDVRRTIILLTVPTYR